MVDIDFPSPSPLYYLYITVIYHFSSIGVSIGKGVFVLELEDIACRIREFEGLTRKKSISGITSIFESVRSEYGKCIIDFGDDAAVIDIDGEDYLLFAADGIWGRLINASPWWAGYSSVLVNINDIAAMGGRAVAMVDVLSTSDEQAFEGILEGIKEGIAKFGVPMVGGHLHPDTPYTSLSVAIVGTVRKDCLLRSDTARVGDSIIAAYDLKGRLGPNSPYSWDSTTMKTPGEIRRMYRVMVDIGELHIATACKDISNPGIIGTLGMLLEVSRVGAVVEVEHIPAPEGVDFVQWLLVHPATGFILTTHPSAAEEVISCFEKAEMSAEVIGRITSGSRLDICRQDTSATVFDFKRDIVTGITVK